MKVLLSEADLVNAITRRNPAGAEALYDRYAATLYKVIRCWEPDMKIAEDLLEKTFYTVWHNTNHCQPQNQHLLLWMAGIARKLARQAGK